MKLNHLILIFLIIFCVKQSYSQLSIGGKTGFTVSTFSYSTNGANKLIRSTLKPKIGVHLAATGEYFFVRGLSVMADIQYVSKGIKYANQYREGKKRYDYAQINIAGKVSFYEGENITISAYAAPFFAYWFHGMETELDYKQRTTFKENIVFNDTVNQRIYSRWDAGVAFGMEIKIKQSYSRKLVFDIHYEHSLINNAKLNVEGTSNRVLFFGIGYYWTIRR